MKPEETEYTNAFNSDGKDESMNPTDDAAEGATETPAVAVVIGAPDAPAADEQGEGMTTDTEATATDPDAAAESTEAGDPAEAMEPGEAGEAGAMDDKDAQRMRSWEGRLKKREEELSAREAALEGGEGAEATDMQTTEASEQIQAVMARAAELRGSPDLDQLVARFVEDFGIDTVAVLALVGAKMAGGQAQANDSGTELSGRIDGLVEQFKDAIQSLQYSQIKTAHEDVEEISESEGFRAWRDSLDETERAGVDDAIENGTPYDVIRVLNNFKKHLADGASKDAGASGEPPMTDNSFAEDAAGAVRGSSPLRLPTRAPANPDDEYKAAWNQQ